MKSLCNTQSTSPNTKEKGAKLSLGKGTGSFSNSLTELEPSTNYYIQAYAVNLEGEAFGAELSFTTLTNGGTDISKPIVITNVASDITQSSAIINGQVTYDGGADVSDYGFYWGINPNPESAGTKFSVGKGAGIFNTTLSGLNDGTSYYVQSYAINEAGESVGTEISFTTLINWEHGEVVYGTMNDIEGNAYKTVTIGAQEWMAENLKVSKYPDGTAIPLVVDNTSWLHLFDNDTDDAYCFYNNNNNGEADVFGALYTYAAAKNACPTGWHLPSDPEWTILENYLADNGYNYDGTAGGGRKKIGKALAAVTNWLGDTREGSVGNNLTLNNASGFTALPAGIRLNTNDGSFLYGSESGWWWSSTEVNSSTVQTRDLWSSSAEIYRNAFAMSGGFSVRCLKD